jgi:hypothetical protein
MPTFMKVREHARAEQPTTPRRSPGVERARLRVGEPDDAREREADRMAGAVVQRKCVACSGDDDRQIRRKADAGATSAGAAPPIVDRVLQSPGSPLSPSDRAFFEHRFGHDFGRVRVHRGPEATTSARSIDALAYTVGDHVVVRDPSLDGSSEPGRRLLAHELAHVIQQRGSTPIVSRQVDAGPPQSDAGASSTGALQAAAGSPPEVQQFLNLMAGRNEVSGVGDPAAAFAILHALSMPRLLDVLGWLARSGFPIGQVGNYANVDWQRIEVAALAVRLRSAGAAVQPEDMAYLRERMPVLAAPDRADVLTFFPAAQLPPQVVVNASDATPPPGSPYAAWPELLRILVVRSFRQRNLGVPGSRHNLDNAFWGGRRSDPWTALDAYGQGERNALHSNFVRSQSVGFPWQQQVESINNAWAANNGGVSFNPRNPAAIRAWLNASADFCRDSWLSNSMHDEPCWRERVHGGPGLHVCVGNSTASMHIDPHQVVQAVDGDGVCDIDYVGSTGRQHGRDEGIIPRWFP